MEKRERVAIVNRLVDVGVAVINGRAEPRVAVKNHPILDRNIESFLAPTKQPTGGSIYVLQISGIQGRVATFFGS